MEPSVLLLSLDTLRTMELKLFGKVYRWWSRAVLLVSVPKLSSTVEAAERLSRYLRDSGQYTASTRHVKGRAFHPNPRDNKASVFRITDLKDETILSLGSHYFDFSV